MLQEDVECYQSSEYQGVGGKSVGRDQRLQPCCSAEVRAPRHLRQQSRSEIQSTVSQQHALRRTLAFLQTMSCACGPQWLCHKRLATSRSTPSGGRAVWEIS